MRTTINIHDDILREAKKLAIEKHTTLGSIVTDALRLILDRRHKPERKKPLRLPTFKGDGLQPGVDLDNSAALLDLMEGR